MDRIDIYPAFDPRYYSLYLLGLRSLVSPSKLRFTTEGFPAFDHDCLALRVGGKDGVRVYIHANDMPEVDEVGLEWSDVVAKVNLDWTLVPDRFRSKVVAAGPTFPVRLWSPVRTAALGILNYYRSPPLPHGLRFHVGCYRALYTTRFSESEYSPGSSRPDYVFFNAALWERETEANSSRARFVDACRSIEGVRFEGGLVPRDSAQGNRGYTAPGFERYISRRYSPRENLEKSKESALALNNPAYRGCHSWRLGEYLAMGKAIVSTPLVREVPAPLLHGTHIHYVDGSEESFRNAILKICGDEAYRRRLEEHARSYYQHHLAPAAVVRRILKAAGVEPLEVVSHGSTPLSD
jgi:hypothetical protein